ncbi:unnamed protein product [Umbelopsis ramanniana]
MEYNGINAQHWSVSQAKNHAEAVDVNSKLSIRCLRCLKTVSYTNYTSSPMISHLLRRHAITVNSPARAEDSPAHTENSPSRTRHNGFANSIMNSYFTRPQNTTFSHEEWDSLTMDLIIDCKLPLTIVEQPSYRKFVNYARLSTHVEIKMADADTLRNRILRSLDQKSKDVKKQYILHVETKSVDHV